MHEILCLGSNGITSEFHPTARVDFVNGVVGKLLSNHLALNGHRIPILGHISINGSVEILGIPNFSSQPMFTENLLAPHYTTVWGDCGTTNQNWPVSWHRNLSVPWRGTVPSRPSYMPRIPDNTHAAACRARDDFLFGRRRVRMRGPSTSCNKKN